MLTALLFDLDGTLTDTNRLHARAITAAMREHGHVVPVERVLRGIGMGAEMLVADVLGPSVTESEAKAIGERHSTLYVDFVEREGVALCPGAVRLVEAVRRHELRVALATSSKQEELERTARAGGLDLGLFDVLTTASDVETAKPAPDPVLVAARDLGVSPAETALVGDTPFDALSARRAGSVLLGVENGTHGPGELRKAGARVVYRHAGALAAHLDEALRTASPGTHALTEALQERLVDAALDEARANADDGGLPIGAVLALPDGTVVSRGRNTAHRSGSPVAHAETEALRAAGRLPDTPGLILATTLEPCVMCLGAALEARLDAVVWALEAPSNGGAERVTAPSEGDAVLPRLVGGVRRSESRALLARYAEVHPEAAFVHRLLAATKA